jgi:hypothetical protein
MMYPQRPEIHPPLAADFFGQLQALIDAFTAASPHLPNVAVTNARARPSKWARPPS